MILISKLSYKYRIKNIPQDNIVKLVWFAAIIFLAVTYGKIIFETVGLFLFFYVFGAFILWIVKNSI